MFGKSLRAALGLSLFTTGLFISGVGHAVDLNDTPYLPSLQPRTPAIIGGNATANRPKAGSSKCFSAATCRDSGSYISGDGILIYKNGDPLQVRPSTRRSVTSPVPSSNHIQWCSNRYRSYRTSDNSYQPFAGPRQGCNSPFQ